jgi:hypothetical protein
MQRRTSAVSVPVLRLLQLLAAGKGRAEQSLNGGAARRCGERALDFPLICFLSNTNMTSLLMFLWCWSRYGLCRARPWRERLKGMLSFDMHSHCIYQVSSVRKIKIGAMMQVFGSSFAVRDIIMEWL